MKASNVFSFSFKGVYAKHRPRFYINKLGMTRAYTPQSTKEAETFVRMAFLSQGGKPLKGYIGIKIETYRKMTKASPGHFDTRKPDADNIAKLILDALNGYAYMDDKQVVMLAVEKRNIEEGEPYTTVKLRSIDYLKGEEK